LQVPEPLHVSLPLHQTPSSHAVPFGLLVQPSVRTVVSQRRQGFVGSIWLWGTQLPPMKQYPESYACAHTPF
jgi:hypothetical protein